MPIHLRAEPGDYADACLLPGDPDRATYLAERYLQDARQVNGVRGLLGYTGTYRGERVSIQATGMGCPSAAIVVEELVMLGVTRLLRIGTCGGLQPDLALGDLVLALSAAPIDGTARRLVGDEPYAPTADWRLARAVADAAARLDAPLRVGPIASADVFYDRDADAQPRWASRGIVAVEMEAAVVFTIAALRGVQAGCVLVVSDLLAGAARERISDEALRAAVDRMAAVALDAVVGGG